MSNIYETAALARNHQQQILGESLNRQSLQSEGVDTSIVNEFKDAANDFIKSGRAMVAGVIGGVGIANSLNINPNDVDQSLVSAVPILATTLGIVAGAAVGWSIENGRTQVDSHYRFYTHTGSGRDEPLHNIALWSFGTGGAMFLATGVLPWVVDKLW